MGALCVGTWGQWDSCRRWSCRISVVGDASNGSVGVGASGTGNIEAMGAVGFGQLWVMKL